ncbi:hypothetical protein ELY21_06180 [Legionella sp. km535]|uniref:hypothetical protein n=1 Tax=Legionella sp. km535 TaxID=2498107 RepID=UPI000F8ECCE8|nr:hypothetical protein [Legionella sp. km535]RUR18806.1 hypothetical protein ELY21_06180 [Legionella sp. km535]
MLTEKQYAQIQSLLKERNLNVDMFRKQDINFEDGINEHVMWANENIYSHPYPDGSSKSHHGILHVARAAVYAVVMANFFRRYNDGVDQEFSNDSLKLTQIAMIFHDSARMSEGADWWDEDSALFLYAYLVEVLKIDNDKAHQFAEFVANKDREPDAPFHSLRQTDEGFSWVLIEPNAALISDGLLGRSRSIEADCSSLERKIIHDSDCLDVNRVRETFKSYYLDFYKSIAVFDQLAFDEMACLVNEVKSIIEKQGDAFKRMRPEVKSYYETEDVFTKVRDTFLKDSNYKITPFLYGNGSLLSGDQLKQDIPKGPLDLSEGKILLRSLVYGNKKTKKAPHKKDNDIESAAEIEFRKTSRSLTQKTRSDKNYYKRGNVNRSTSILLSGGGVFGSAGCRIVHVNIDDIKQIYERNAYTGKGKKRGLKFDDSQTREQKEEQIAALIKAHKLGIDNPDGTNHTEIIYDVTEYHDIYYTLDPIVNVSPFHPLSPLLQALFIKNEALKFGMDLPIVKISCLHNMETIEPEHSDEELIQMWTTLCNDFIQNTLKDMSKFSQIERMSVGDLSTCGLYGIKDDLDNYLPAYSNYPVSLQEQIIKSIEGVKRDSLLKMKECYIEKLTSDLDNGITETNCHDIICALDNDLIDVTLKEYLIKLAKYIIDSNELSPENFFALSNNSIFMTSYRILSKFSSNETVEAVNKIAEKCLNTQFNQLMAPQQMKTVFTGRSRNPQIRNSVTLKQLEQFAIQFDIKTSFNKLLNSEIAALAKKNFWSKVDSLIRQIHVQLLHDNELNENLSNTLGELEQKLISGAVDNDGFLIYLKLAKFFDVPKPHVEQITLEWMKHNNYPITVVINSPQETPNNWITFAQKIRDYYFLFDNQKIVDGLIEKLDIKLEKATLLTLQFCICPFRNPVDLSNIVSKEISHNSSGDKIKSKVKDYVAEYTTQIFNYRRSSYNEVIDRFKIFSIDLGLTPEESLDLLVWWLEEEGQLDVEKLEMGIEDPWNQGGRISEENKEFIINLNKICNTKSSSIANLGFFSTPKTIPETEENYDAGLSDSKSLN